MLITYKVNFFKIIKNLSITIKKTNYVFCYFQAIFYIYLFIICVFAYNNLLYTFRQHYFLILLSNLAIFNYLFHLSIIIIIIVFIIVKIGIYGIIFHIVRSNIYI